MTAGLVAGPIEAIGNTLSSVTLPLAACTKEASDASNAMTAPA